MKCEDCLDVIEEYFDKELNALGSIEVAAHLIACPTCAEVHEALKQEHAAYASYKRDIEVTPALWQGIQSRLKAETVQPVIVQETPAESIGLFERLRSFFAETMRAPRFSPALSAALVIVAVGATVVVMNYLNSRNQSAPVAINNSTPGNNGNQTPDSSNAVSPNPNVATSGDPGKKAKEDADPNSVKKEVVADDVKPKIVKTIPEKVIPQPAIEHQPLAKNPNPSADKLVRDAERKYLAAITLLKRDYDKRRTQLNPQFIAKMDAALSTIDNTIAETRKAVKQNPDDPIALQYMLAAYAKKVEVLKGVSGS